MKGCMYIDIEQDFSKKKEKKGPRPAIIPVLPNGAGASTESSPLYMQLGIWNGWMGKTRKTANAKKSNAKSNLKKMRKKRKGKKKCG